MLDLWEVRPSECRAPLPGERAWHRPSSLCGSEDPRDSKCQAVWRERLIPFLTSSWMSLKFGVAQNDVALVTVRRDQLAGVMPELTANWCIPTVLFMLNNPTGSIRLVHALGKERVLLGFPGASGTRDGPIVRYPIIAQQPTTLGELGGQRTERLLKVAEAFRRSGFTTRISRDIDTWLKVHAFFVTAISGAIYLVAGELSSTLRGQLLPWG